MPHSNSDLSAIVLATALGSVAPAPMILEVELRVKPIRRVIESMEPPLDLEADVFRYRIENGRIVPATAEPENKNGIGLFADATRTEVHHHARASETRGSGSRRSWSATSRPRRRR